MIHNNRFFNIEYLKDPMFTKNAGIGGAISNLGDIATKLGAIGFNRQKQEEETNFKNIMLDNQKRGLDIQDKGVEYQHDLGLKNLDISKQNADTNALNVNYNHETQNKALNQKDHQFGKTYNLNKTIADQQNQLNIAKQLYENQNLDKKLQNNIDVAKIRASMLGGRTQDKNAIPDGYVALAPQDIQRIGEEKTPDEIYKQYTDYVITLKDGRQIIPQDVLSRIDNMIDIYKKNIRDIQKKEVYEQDLKNKIHTTLMENTNRQIMEKKRKDNIEDLNKSKNFYGKSGIKY